LSALDAAVALAAVAAVPLLLLRLSLLRTIAAHEAPPRPADPPAR